MRPAPLAWLALLALLSPGAAPADAGDASGDDWKAARSGSGEGYAYRIFSNQTEGGEAVVRYRVRGTVDAEPDALVSAVRAIASDPERAPDRQKRRLLSANGNVFITHTVIDMPPMFTDRDIVTRGVSSFDARSGVHRIEWAAIEHPDAPEGDGAVRIEEGAGFWSFTPIDRNSSRVGYETHIDLGGSLPAWLIQSMIAAMVGTHFEHVAQEALSR